MSHSVSFIIAKTGIRQPFSLQQDQKIDLLLTYGKISEIIVNVARKAGMDSRQIHHFTNKQKLVAFIKPKLKKNDVVLVKGSRGMKMEQIVRRLKKG